MNSNTVFTKLSADIFEGGDIVQKEFDKERNTTGTNRKNY